MNSTCSISGLRRSTSRAAILVLTWLLAVCATPVAARTIYYVGDQFQFNLAWYVVLSSSDNKARLVGQYGAQNGTYTDNGTETLVTLKKPLSYEYWSADVDCNGFQYQQRTDIKQVYFRRVDNTNPNKGKSRVVEIGEIVDVTGCTPGKKTPFGSVSDEGFPVYHRAPGSRAPMTDVAAGLTIAGFREDPYVHPSGVLLAADIVTLESNTTLRFARSNRLVNAALTSDQWLVLDLTGFQRGYTRIVVDTAKGMETWMEATFKDGKPQTVTCVMITKPLPGASFGTKAQTARMWESFVGLGTNNPFFFYLYGNNKGDRVSKDLAAATESRVPITWRYEGLDVITSRNSGSTLRERRWTPLGRTGKYMSVMEQEVQTYPGDPPWVSIPPRVVFYVDRGKAVPPAP